MGRMERAKKQAAVTLDPAEYWEFRARIKDAQVAKAEAEKLLRQASATFQEYFNGLAKKHGFDPSVNYRWDDKTQTLTPIDLKASA